MFALSLLTLGFVQQSQTPSSAQTAAPVPPYVELTKRIAISGPNFDTGLAYGQGAMPIHLFMGGGVSKGITVLLPEKTLQYITLPDFQRKGLQEPTTTFWRIFRSDMALRGEGSPGMPPGWITNYDVSIAPINDTEKWRRMKLRFPNGSLVELTPLLTVDGFPTGEFQRPAGQPFSTTGTPGKTTNQWDDIKIYAGDVNWTFTLTPDNKYRLTSLRSSTGAKGIEVGFDYDKYGRLLGVFSRYTNKWIVSLTYGDYGYLQTIARTDTKTAFKLTYDSNPDLLNGSPVLRSFNRIESDGKENLSRRYNYKVVKNQFLLTAISAPEPNGKAELVTSRITYDENGKVIEMTDALGNKVTLN
jgi:hypothetical protein